MLAPLRALAAALLAFASLTVGFTPALAEAIPEAPTACAGGGHAHETRTGTLSVLPGRAGCDQCEHGCTTPGHCVTSASLAVAEAAPVTPLRRPEPTRYDIGSDLLRSTSATPPIPPPQPDS
jgi:hypothetical protein